MTLPAVWLGPCPDDVIGRDRVRADVIAHHDGVVPDGDRHQGTPQDAHHRPGHTGGEAEPVQTEREPEERASESQKDTAKPAAVDQCLKARNRGRRRTAR